MDFLNQYGIKYNLDRLPKIYFTSRPREFLQNSIRVFMMVTCIQGLIPIYPDESERNFVSILNHEPSQDVMKTIWNRYSSSHNSGSGKERGILRLAFAYFVLEFMLIVLISIGAL